MRYDKLILRSFLTTLVAVIVLLGLTFGVLSLWIPQTMMKISYAVGMDKASVDFATTAYEKFGVVDYAGYGADVALQAGLHSEAETCLESLIADE